MEEELWKRHPHLSEWLEMKGLSEETKEIFMENVGVIGNEKVNEFEGSYKKVEASCAGVICAGIGVG